MLSEPTSHWRENQNKGKEVFIKLLHEEHFVLMFHESKSFREFRWAWSKILDHRDSPTEAVTETYSLKIAIHLITLKLYNLIQFREASSRICPNFPSRGFKKNKTSERINPLSYMTNVSKNLKKKFPTFWPCG